ncbi:MAG: hypothetical protein RIR48_1350 [Bacteroidota bacterium]|jgi:hypothetical protein
MANIGDQSIGNLNIFVKQGNTKNITLSFYDVLPDKTKVPIDLTTYSEIKMDIKSKIDVNATPFVSWTIDDGLTIIGDNNNVLSFTFDTQFLASQSDKWYYDILFTDGDGNDTLVGGIINVRRVVTG